VAIEQGGSEEIAPDEVPVLAAEVAKVLKPVAIPLRFGGERPHQWSWSSR
jgi:hypothetical protein